MIKCIFTIICLLHSKIFNTIIWLLFRIFNNTLFAFLNVLLHNIRSKLKLKVGKCFVTIKDWWARQQIYFILCQFKSLRFFSL